MKSRKVAIYLISFAFLAALLTLLPPAASAQVTPGGSNCNLQYNNSGSFGGAAGLCTPDGNSLDIAGPTPHVDVAAPAYGARAIVATGYTTTCSVSSGSTALGCAYAAQFQNGDGISVYGAGATNSLSTPSPPTVTPSLAAHSTGTGVDVNAPNGSTNFSYKIVALGTWSATSANNLWGAYTPASTAGSTTTGNALGSQTQTISTLSEAGGVLTIACSSTCSMSPGAYVAVSGTSNDSFFAGQYVVASVTNTTTFTVNVGNSTSATITGTGGTLGWFVSNHITWTAVTGAFEYAVYGRTSSGYSLLGFSWPGVTWFDDFGSTMTANLTSYGWLPTTAPSSAQNGVLTTTVTAGGGTTSLTIATAAGNSVTSGFATFDVAPAFTSAMAVARHYGSYMYIPPTGGSAYFVIGSYLPFLAYNYSPGVFQSGQLWLDDPIEWDNAVRWTGEPSGQPPGASSQQFEAAPIVVNSAFPGIYGNNSNTADIDRVMVEASYSAQNQVLLAYMNGGTILNWNHSYFSTSSAGSNYDYMSIAMVISADPDITLDGDMFAGGPVEAPNLTTTPLIAVTNSILFTMKNIGMNRRGVAYFGPGTNIRLEDKNWFQGPITPFLAFNNCSQPGIGGIVINSPLQDTSGQPILANWCGGTYEGGAEINSPSLDAPNEVVTGAGVANLTMKDEYLPAYGGATLGQNSNYQLDAQAYLQPASANYGTSGGVQELSKPAYQAQPNPQNYFIEQLPPAPSSSAASGGSLTGTHYYGVVAFSPNGTSRTSPQGNSVALSGSNGTIVSTWSAVPGAVMYDVWDLTRGLPTACVGLTALTCTDNGGGLTASGGEPNAPTDGDPSIGCAITCMIHTPMLMATGTKAALTGTGACLTADLTNQLGGQWAGQVECTNTTGTSTLIITPGQTAKSGWSCWASDLTQKTSLAQSAVSTTASTMSGTVDASDTLTFGCVAY